MNALEKAREKINRIDKEMASLFEERMQAVEEVVQYKIENNMQVLDASREKQLIEKNLSYIQMDKYKESYRKYMDEMLKISRNYQQCIIHKDKIGYGGTKGAFTHIATMNLFPNHEYVAYTTFSDVVKAVEKGEVEYGVIPFENSYTGEVEETSELLRDHEVYIHKMYDLKVTQNLLGVPGASISDIKKVYSHPQGLSQCSLFLKGRDWECFSYPNTALAAQMIQERQDKTIAAIASLETAEVYHLEVLEKDINTSKENTTRFIVIHKQVQKEGNAFQMLFTVNNEAGALAKAINCIADYGYNMKSIKSKAIPDTPWSYYFHVELDGNLASEQANNMLTQLKQYCSDIKILGGYTKKEG